MMQFTEYTDETLLTVKSQLKAMVDYLDRDHAVDDPITSLYLELWSAIDRETDRRADLYIALMADMFIDGLSDEG